MHNRTDGLIPGTTTLQLAAQYGDVLSQQERARRRDRERRADISDAPPWAVELAARRKELSVLDKAAAAWRLRDECRWTQSQIGKLFGVSGAAVYNWTKQAQDPNYVARCRANSAEWREQNRYHSAAYQRAWRERAQHGSGDVRATLWREQDGKCYLCERPLGPNLMAIVEHDHRCCPVGKSCAVCRRGLACQPCNALIGFADDDADRLETIARNLRTALNSVTARLAAQ